MAGTGAQGRRIQSRAFSGTTRVRPASAWRELKDPSGCSVSTAPPTLPHHSLVWKDPELLRLGSVVTSLTSLPLCCPQKWFGTRSNQIRRGQDRTPGLSPTQRQSAYQPAPGGGGGRSPRAHRPWPCFAPLPFLVWDLVNCRVHGSSKVGVIQRDCPSGGFLEARLGVSSPTRQALFSSP